MLPHDPRFDNLDQQLMAIAGDSFLAAGNLTMIHLRDTRLLLPDTRDNRVLAKACVVLASAALESNLSYLSGLGLALANARPSAFVEAQREFLQGERTAVDDSGNLVQKRLKQTLEERLRIVPKLIGTAIRRKYELPVRSAAIRKLRATLERRDIIIHPRWDRYLRDAGWFEAAEAIDAVELYLQSVHLQLHPYLAGYFALLGTLPPGWHKHDGVDVGYRTRGKRNLAHPLAAMRDYPLAEVILREWFDAAMVTKLALTNGVEGDSEGSSLTRAALILLYAMIDAQLSIISQWKLSENLGLFEAAEIAFLNEIALGVGHDGEPLTVEDHQAFKQRIIAVPRILARRVCQRDVRPDLGQSWGADLMKGHALRNELVHSPLGTEMPRVTITELLTTAKAVKRYFEELVNIGSARVYSRRTGTEYRLGPCWTGFEQGPPAPFSAPFPEASGYREHVRLSPCSSYRMISREFRKDKASPGRKVALAEVPARLGRLEAETRCRNQPFAHCWPLQDILDDRFASHIAAISGLHIPDFPDCISRAIVFASRR